jgi:Protein of unknown function (DUF1580)
MTKDSRMAHSSGCASFFMTIDPFTETVGTFSKLAKMLPHTRNNRPVHANTLRRWAFIGRRGVKLETIVIGGVTCSSREALTRFFERLTNLKQPDPQPVRDVERQEFVEEKLRRFGL